MNRKKISIEEIKEAYDKYYQELNNEESDFKLFRFTNNEVPDFDCILEEILHVDYEKECSENRAILKQLSTGDFYKLEFTYSNNWYDDGSVKYIEQVFPEQQTITVYK